jgi:hypothetical protein
MRYASMNFEGGSVAMTSPFGKFLPCGVRSNVRREIESVLKEQKAPRDAGFVHCLFCVLLALLSIGQEQGTDSSV